MNYLELIIQCPDEAAMELYIAVLSADGFEGFMEEGLALKAYIPQAKYDRATVDLFLGNYNLKGEITTIEKTNWNSNWEKNFEPIKVGDFCGVRAGFHQPMTDVEHEIIITPKMSFGTGHHATTQMMIRLMRGIDFVSKKTLDFGCGTGILSILAHKLGASMIVAVDHEEWACENAAENARENGVELSIIRGSMEQTEEIGFDIILANINRNILLQYMEDIAAKTKYGGVVLMSGLLAEDKDMIVGAASANELIFEKEDMLNGWIALLFRKITR